MDFHIIGLQERIHDPEGRAVTQFPLNRFPGFGKRMGQINIGVAVCPGIVILAPESAEADQLSHQKKIDQFGSFGSLKGPDIAVFIEPGKSCTYNQQRI